MRSPLLAAIGLAASLIIAAQTLAEPGGHGPGPARAATTGPYFST